MWEKPCVMRGALSARAALGAVGRRVPAAHGGHTGRNSREQPQGSQELPQALASKSGSNAGGPGG